MLQSEKRKTQIAIFVWHTENCCCFGNMLPSPEVTVGNYKKMEKRTGQNLLQNLFYLFANCVKKICLQNLIDLISTFFFPSNFAIYTLSQIYYYYLQGEVILLMVRTVFSTKMRAEPLFLS